MPGLFFLIVPAFIALFVVLAIHSHKKEKERQAMLAGWASASGMVFSAEKVRDFQYRFPLDCFQRGKNRYAYNVSAGERGGYRMLAGDYHYETESRDSDGKTSTTHHHFSFAVFAPPFLLHKLTVRREGFFDRIGSAFGFDDIDFESAEFSKAFHVKCDDRRWAYDAIHPRTMEMMLRHRDLRWEAAVTGLAVHDDKRWEVPQFEHYANAATEFLDGIPDHAKEAL